MSATANRTSSAHRLCRRRHTIVLASHISAPVPTRTCQILKRIAFTISNINWLLCGIATNRNTQADPRRRAPCMPSAPCGERQRNARTKP